MAGGKEVAVVALPVYDMINNGAQRLFGRAAPQVTTDEFIDNPSRLPRPVYLLSISVISMSVLGHFYVTLVSVLCRFLPPMKSITPNRQSTYEDFPLS